jgi:hypothetical protein
MQQESDRIHGFLLDAGSTVCVEFLADRIEFVPSQGIPYYHRPGQLTESG